MPVQFVLYLRSAPRTVQRYKYIVYCITIKSTVWKTVYTKKGCTPKNCVAWALKTVQLDLKALRCGQFSLYNVQCTMQHRNVPFTTIFFKNSGC